jgi:hypothetical protein
LEAVLSGALALLILLFVCFFTCTLGVVLLTGGVIKLA